MTDDVLERFSPATRAWFRGSFSAPTAAQAGAWQAISSGRHTLVVAPTGSGKTLSAFLWALDRLATEPPPKKLKRCRVLYVSPLKALAVDVERNLRSPLVGIGHEAARLGLEPPGITVAVRSGDTPADQRRSFAREPSDILITTPESLFLLLTSAARETLAGIETVIVDEIHALAGGKRGAHLALSLERLDALLPRPAQRIGLSATVRPIEEVGRFLAGGRPVEIVNPPSEKRWDLSVVVPVPDLGALGETTDDLSGPAASDPRRTSIWPHVEERIVDLVAAHRSTLVFANSRRLAERLTARLNEIWAERQDSAAEPASAQQSTPAQVMAQSGQSAGAPALIARAHHGSVSKEQRAATEEDLKAGRLPAVVATSSLELGIDMGAVDLVVQVEAPPSVASGLQRVGRAGHQVGATSRGVLFPKFRGDLVQTAVITERMRAGAIESLRVPSNPLDVLAQQIVAICALDDITVGDLEQLVRRAAPFTGLTRGVLESVLDMLAGRYPSDAFAELRPRLVWDRTTDLLTGRRGAQRLAVTSGGTIPDRGMFGVFITGDGAGRRVGELDEEMVYESRVGDVITLGTSTWRIEDITHDQVQVSPAPGQPGRLPFWKGDTLGRPAELGRALGAFVRELGALSPDAARDRARRAGLDDWAADNLVDYLTEQREAIPQLPSDTTIVVERFRDELGDWRVVVHSPFGAPVHAPWALAIAARLRESHGVDVQAMHGDDGIVLRLPEVGWADDAEHQPLPDLLEAIVIDPDEVAGLVTDQIGGSALFASRFRECAGRALLLPKRRPDRRQALWQQRQRASQLLQVASEYPSFPIVLEAVRECVQDVFDVPALVDLMRAVASRQVRTVEVTTSRPSPFAGSLLFGYVAQFLYEGDSPLAEKRAAALTLDPTLLSELLGSSEGLALADLLDPESLTRTENELQHLADGRRARDAEDLADIIRVLGPLDLPALQARSDDAQATARWLVELTEQRRVIEVRIGGGTRWAAVEDAGRLIDALGVTVPVGVPEVHRAPVPDPLGDLVLRYARHHAPFLAGELAAWLGLGHAVVHGVLRRLVGEGRLVEGDLRPNGGGAIAYCDPGVLRVLRRRSLAALRDAVEPVPARQFARFLQHWQGLPAPLPGTAGLLSAVQQLAGYAVPASSLESLVLPVRVAGYAPAMLDELLATGEVVWQGAGALAGTDGWVTLHPAELAPLTLQRPGEVPGELGQRVLEALDGGGSYLFRALASRLGVGDGELSETLWSLVWAGHVTNDTLAPLRALLGGGRASLKARPAPARGRFGRRPMPRGPLPRPAGPPETAGRWSLLPIVEADPTVLAAARAEVLLDRYGIVTRGSVAAEEVAGGFASAYRVFSAFEDAGQVRRGYFVEGLGASQFGDRHAVDLVREAKPIADAVVLAASDPANPYGAALPWPARDQPGRHQPGRKAGALVVLSDGALTLYVERGGRTVLSYSAEPEVLAAAAAALARAVHAGVLGRLTVAKIDGESALGSDNALAEALAGAGFRLTPQGLRLRR
ncbi:ATP-dependent helicase [Micropruina sonneratiae]|uniref:ATP-dependent helicase n=1 Tax=Micropruina sonneratiae TaxID=2986940 RepID=UPI0022272EA2|nr:ATP-dependent helicase [Micropruina sp. KQZ13P-5]MCW3159328.1 ATP-dependent helicase [Micropruina sp. KQZ13P-5]